MQGAPASCVPWGPGPYLTILGLPEWKRVQEMRCAGQSRRAKNSGAKASTRGAQRAQAASQPWRSLCWGCHSTGPGGSRQGGDRKGRGRPLGGTHCTSRFRADRRDAKQGGSGGGDGAHFPHGCHQRLRSMALRKRDDTRNKDTNVTCTLPVKAVLHKREPTQLHTISSSSTSCFHTACSGPHS